MVLCGNKGYFREGEEDSLRLWIPHALFQKLLWKAVSSERFKHLVER